MRLTDGQYRTLNVTVSAGISVRIYAFMWLPAGFLKPSRAGQCDGRPRDDGKSRVFLDASPAPRSNTRPLRLIPPSRALAAPISIGPAHGQVAQLVEQRTENPRVD